MTQKVDRNKIIAFIFDTLSSDEVSLVADAILSDENFKKIYEEEKEKILTHCYADNELQPYERIEFEIRLKTDKQLTKEVALLKDINKSIENLTFKETLEEIYEDYTSKKEYNTPITIPINKKLKHWLVAASITVLLILGGGITYHYQTRDSLENRLYVSYYAPFEDASIYFMIKSNSLSKAKEEYSKGNFSEALLLLENVPDSYSISIERQFYLALTLMEVQAYSEAIKEFNSILNQRDIKDIRQYVNWYLGLCYLKTGKKNEAKEIFKSIVEENKYNHKKANKILKKLQ